jgi:hypothetical protein
MILPNQQHGVLDGDPFLKMDILNILLEIVITKTALTHIGLTVVGGALLLV